MAKPPKTFEELAASLPELESSAMASSEPVTIDHLILQAVQEDLPRGLPTDAARLTIAGAVYYARLGAREMLVYLKKRAKPGRGLGDGAINEWLSEVEKELGE